MRDFRTQFGRSFYTVDNSLLERLESVISSQFPVLIMGETGTGKELIARAIYEYGKRANKPLIAVNCALIPKDNLYGELFGVEDKAFTGVVGRRGAFEEADSGTIFLDEIGDLPADAQAGLLRVLETGTVKKLGAEESKNSRKVDVRIIAATNKDIKNPDVLRSDLYYRLNVLPVYTSPLRHNREVIPCLLKKYLPELGIRMVDFHYYAFCISNNWLGNVREFLNFCRNSSVSVLDGKVVHWQAVDSFYKDDLDVWSQEFQLFKSHIPDILIENDEYWEDPPPLFPVMTSSVEDYRYWKIFESFHASIVKEKTAKNFGISITRMKIQADEGIVDTPYYSYPDILVEEIPCSQSKTDGHWHLDEDVSSDGQAIIYRITARLLELCRDYDIGFAGDGSVRGHEQYAHDRYDRAKAEFERRYYTRIFNLHGHLTDNAIAQLTGQDPKTIKLKRQTFGME